MSFPVISEDDDSFEVPGCSKGNVKDAEAHTICISSDEEVDTKPPVVARNSLEDELPLVDLKKKLKIFKRHDKREKFVKNFFSKATINQPEEIKVEEKPPGVMKMIGGVPVQFPVNPYGAQIALMSKVIESLNKSVNCLLESPTGSGKTLALLCAALAWQKHEHDRIASFQAQAPAPADVPVFEAGHAATAAAAAGDPRNDELFNRAPFGEKSIYNKPQNGWDDASTSSKRAEPAGLNGSPQKGLVSIHKKRRIGEMPERPSTPTKAGDPSSAGTPQKVGVTQPAGQNEGRNVKVPTIYYGARTHKQIQQVVKEFARTAYCGRGARMTVLSSREHSCVRDLDRALYAGRDDMCRECVAKARPERGATNCAYYDNRKELSHATLPPAFDLDQLVAAGRERRACPYYAARLMAAGARVVFCPYNYLIDPGIRSALQIELRDEIVVLDEAHNIEDICREAATRSYTRDQVQAALKELEVVTGYEMSNRDVMPQILELVRALKNWNDWFGNQLPLAGAAAGGGEAVHVWQTAHFVRTLDNHAIGAKEYQDFHAASEAFCAKWRDDPATLFGVTQSTASLVESLAGALGYIFGEGGRHADAFTPALVTSAVVSTENTLDSAGWRSKEDTESTRQCTALRLLCMSPAVVFAALGGARSVLLASGTLAPLGSLRSELGAAFPLQVSPAHVVARDRVWVGTLGTCPDGAPLECTARGTASARVQDALGAALRWAARVTPHGALCFVPSYRLMYQLVERWRSTGVWRQLQELKHVFIESRSVKDHGQVMEEYYRCAESARGALLFAVYRGKVSEGMDFRDHQARAVITIGIPYPNTRELMVKEKMSYNDRHAAARALLPSREWLRVQAYRALNQAVGRCVRHRGDWGAVLLLDARFADPYYTEHLARWLRNFLGSNHLSWERLVHGADGMESFMQHMTSQEEEG